MLQSMKRPIISTRDIEPEVLGNTFTEVSGHHTLGESFGVAAETGAVAMPVGTVVFIKGERADDPAYDSVGMILGHDGDKVNVLSLLPKDGQAWGTHNAYGQIASEVPDAVAALQRLFDPGQEFGSIAVISRVTGGLLVSEAAGTRQSSTLKAAGCDSHEKQQLNTTLNLSQLLDRYTYKPEKLRADSALFRRDGEGQIMALAPGENLEDQPDQTMRDQKSLLDRIQLLAGDRRSALSGVSEVSILNGIVRTVESGAFERPESPVSDITRTIQSQASRITA
jgi:hypothetical protein